MTKSTLNAISLERSETDSNDEENEYVIPAKMSISRQVF